MRTINNAAEFAAQGCGQRRWRATLAAIDGAPRLPAEVSHSIGPLLTYRRTATPPTGGTFSGHRRYLALICPLTGDWPIEVAAKSQLVTAQPYSDLTDRQHFTGSGTRYTLPAGSITVVDIDEAYRFPEQGTGEVVLLHVTIVDQ